MASLDLPTAAVWSWYSDKGWAPFDKKVNDRVEKEYLAIVNAPKKLTNAEKRIKLDDQRFLDLAFKNEADIKSNFANMDKEEHLVGVQRRYDDETKRRAVRREVPALLAGELVVLVGFEGGARDQLLHAVQAYGAATHPRVTQKVTLVLCAPAAYEAERAKSLAKALEYSTPVVACPDALVACIAAGKRPPAWDPWLLKPKPAPAPAPPAPAPAAAAPPVDDKKRKADDEDEKAGSKKAKAQAADAEGFEWQRGASLWRGVCVYKLSGERFPFEMEMAGAGPALAGTMVWTTLNDCTTRWRGTLGPGGALSFEEHELVSGDEVEVPVRYAGTAAAKVLSGRALLQGLAPGEEVSFQLDLVRCVAPADVLRPGARLRGTCFSPLGFRLVVEKREGKDGVAGRLEWPSLACRTAFRGRLQPAHSVQWTEAALLAGDPQSLPAALPQHYQAAWEPAAAAFAGHYSGGAAPGGKHEGSFSLAARPPGAH